MPAAQATPPQLCATSSVNLCWTQMERPHPASWLPDHKDPKVKKEVPDMPVRPPPSPSPPLPQEVSTVLLA